MSNLPKISIIGAGNVGASAAYRALELNLSDVVLLDIVEGLPQGKALDLTQMLSVSGSSSKIIGTNNYSDTKNSDLVIITSGLARKPGMSRDDLITTNTKIIKEVTEKVVENSPNTILIVVTNPLDAMTYVSYKVSNFPKERVMGMAGVLDTARFKAFLSMELDVAASNISALVLGGHGDDMVPLKDYTSVSGIPISQLIKNKKLDEIIQRTRDGGAEIVKLLKTGSAFYAPGVSAIDMAESILKDQKKLLPTCVFADGEYGIKNQFLGLPAVLSSKGVEKIVEVSMSEDEKKELAVSASHVKDLCNLIDNLKII
ncbi:MAG: malate dehydrogenase [Thermodesulfobacteriota bacterium]|nr:malate dehydrogenase [Thermodesulfobacteriota bacterium]